MEPILILVFAGPVLALGLGLASVVQFLRGRRASAGQLALLTGAAFFAALIISNLASRWVEKQVFAEICGVPMRPDSVFAFDTPRGADGVGYSLHVFDVPEDLVPRMTNAAGMAAAGLPQLGRQRAGWTRVEWRQGPRTNDEGHLDALLYTSDGNEEVQKMRDWMRKSLQRPDALYAYRYLGQGVSNQTNASLRSLDFFLIVPAEHRLLVVNHNR